MMQVKNLLGLSIRIIAVLLIVSSLRDLVQSGSFIFTVAEYNNNQPIGLEFISVIVAPLLVFVVAVYLIKSADRIA